MGDVLRGDGDACPCLSRCWGRNGWDSTNSSPLSCFCTISLLGSGKMEENKENDLGPPLPQSYAATVARQSTVPSTSTMPGKHRVCPASAICQRDLGQSGKSPNLPEFNQKHHSCNADGASRTLELSTIPKIRPGVFCSVSWELLLALPLLVQSCPADRPTGRAGTTSELHSLSDSSCSPAGFQELNRWLWKSALTGLVARSLQILPNC